MPPETVSSYQQCNKINEHIPLQETYLLENTPDCKIQIGDYKLSANKEQTVTIKNNDYFKLQFGSYTVKLTFQPIKLSTLNFEELNNIITSSLQLQTETLKVTSTVPIAFSHLLIWLPILSICFICEIVSACYFYFNVTRSRMKPPILELQDFQGLHNVT